MEKKVTVLIVEDEKHYAILLRKMTESLGYEVVGWASNVLEALQLIVENRPDVVLLDINLATGTEGFEVAQYLKDNFLNTPFIFMTSLIDKATLQQAGKLKPHAYLPKPYRANELFAAVETAIINDEEAIAMVEEEDTDDALRNGCVFVRTQQTFMIKIQLADIILFEADRNYTTFFSAEKKYTIKRNLSYVENRIEADNFLRVHRSYIVNAHHIQKVSYYKIILSNNMEISLGRAYKESIEKFLEKIKSL